MMVLTRWLRCSASLVILCWAHLAVAYRPFDGTDADVAEVGELELEVGPAGYRREGSSQFLIAPALVANYGFASGFEAVLEGRQEIPLRAARPGSQVQDLAASVKSLLRRGSLQGDAGLSVALESGVLLPGPETGWGTHVGSIFSYQWPALTMHLNLNNDLWYSAQYEAGASLILEGPKDWRLRPIAEILAERAFGQARFYRGLAESVLLGGILRHSDALSLDVAGRLASAEGQREVEVRAGFTWAFELGAWHPARGAP